MGVLRMWYDEKRKYVLAIWWCVITMWKIKSWFQLTGEREKLPRCVQILRYEIYKLWVFNIFCFSDDLSMKFFKKLWIPYGNY